MIGIANEVAQVFEPAHYETSALQQQYDQLPIKTKKALQVTGQDLMQAGIKPGPDLGKSLQYLERQVVTGQVVNESATLVAAALAYLN